MRLISQPLMLAVNLPFALATLSLLASTVLSGYGTFLLVRYLLGRSWTGGGTASPVAWRGGA